MLIISLDAVGDREFDILAQYPVFSKFINNAAVYRDVSSIFVSNTYPIHASIATGVLPYIHGVTANYKPFPENCPIWYENETNIRVKTIWQAAAEKGINTATVLWPVTGSSKTIRYNIPEIHKRTGENFLITNLKAGSKLLQFKMTLKYGRLLDGINQPNLDDFSTSCMVDILKKYKPGLALIHLLAYDSLCHKHGRDSEELDIAYNSINNSLTRLLEIVDMDSDVIIFSDHAQMNFHTPVFLNKMLVKLGLLNWDGVQYIPGDSGCFVESCGGCAFFHAGGLSESSINEMKNKISKSEGFRRFLTDEEMYTAGQTSAFGFCALDGYSYYSFPNEHKATHGYPLDMPDYKVFYAIRGKGITPGIYKTEGNILDVTSLAAKRLNIVLND